MMKAKEIIKYIAGLIVCILFAVGIGYASGFEVTGRLPIDYNSNYLQTTRAFVTTDGLLDSPLAVSSVEKTLAVPGGGVELIIWCDEAVRVKATSGSTDYFVSASNTGLTLPLATSSNVYLIRDSVDATCSFMFTKI